MYISVDSVTELFKTHFEEPSNDRILFSGRFGSGKSYFLRKFFESKINSTFWIQPVSYSVSSNENIFEYIKFDLVIKLLGSFNAISKEKTEFSDSLLTQQYLISHPIEAISDLVSVLGSFSEKAKIIGEAINKALEFHKGFKKFKEIHNANSDEQKSIEFLKDISVQKGSIYEDDIITQIVRIGINALQSQLGEKITLIVDDLDRLDPEHIFRILNIFSVHNDYYSSRNKFDFDRIILVCDYDNIQKSFEHRYGNGVDFEGYIDKFYTNDVFRFDNETALIFFCEEYIAPLIKDDNLIILLKMILKELVGQNKLTVRSIIKSKYFIEKMNVDFYNIFRIVDTVIDVSNPFPNQSMRFSYGIENIINNANNSFFIESSEVNFLKIIKLLSIMCGDFERLKEYIDFAKKHNSNSYDFSLATNISIINSLYMIVNIMDNYDESMGVFFGINYSGSSKYLDYPKVTLFGHSFPVELIWNRNNKFAGTIGYFSESKLAYSQEHVKQFSNPLKLVDIFTVIQNILEFLESKGLHYKLGMTSR